VPTLESAGVKLLLENLPYRADYPYLTMRELRPLADAYPARAVGLVVDTGHAGTLGDDPSAEIRIAGDRLGSTHLQDIDGEAPDDQHWAPGAGALDWLAIRQALSDVGYHYPWLFEVAHSRSAETADELVAITRRISLSWDVS